MSVSPRRFVALLSASLVLVLAAVSAGCWGEDELPTSPEPVLGTIQGQVTADGEPLAAVIVTLSRPGSGLAQTTTTSDGRYSFSDVVEGVSAVTISGYPADVSFPSTSRTVAVSQDGEVVEANFAGSRVRTASISGTVTLDGAAAANVTIQLDGDRTNTTDAQGGYNFTALEPGQHVVTITPPGDAECTPTQHTVDVAAGAQESADFSCVTEAADEDLTAGQVSGDYDVHYSGGSGCGQQVDPFTEGAQVTVVPQGGGHLVEIDFPNGPLLNGDIDLTTGSFTATTGRVDISEDQEAEETYEDGNFQAGDAGQNTSFTATSTFIVYDKATGDEVCQLTIPVSGEKQ